MRYCALPLMGSVLAMLAAGAHAQERAGSYDPALLPVFHGQVQLFTLTPRGDIDGLVLTDGTEVKTPPHLSTEIALTVRPGDAITIHGLKAAKLPLVQAVSLTNDRDGKSVVDQGPTPMPSGVTGKAVESRAITGRVRMVLHGPRGEGNGVLLDDGTILKMPPPDVDRFAMLLVPGHPIAVDGNTRVTVAGTVVEVTALGASPEKLQPVQ